MIREIVTRVETREEVTDEALEQARLTLAGSPARNGEGSAKVAELGADAVVGEESSARYRFADFETEAAALDEEREHADDAEDVDRRKARRSNP